MSENKLRCESWCKDCRAFDWGYCTEKYFKDENVVLSQPDVSINEGSELRKGAAVCELCRTPMMTTEDGHLKCMNLNCNGFVFTH